MGETEKIISLHFNVYFHTALFFGKQLLERKIYKFRANCFEIRTLHRASQKDRKPRIIFDEPVILNV